MVIRIWRWSWRFGPYMTVEIGTRAGHKIIVKCREFDWRQGMSYKFTGMPSFTSFAIALEDIEYMRRIN